MNEAMAAEYSVRRQMLLKRLEVTMQSFGWDDPGPTSAAPAVAVPTAASASVAMQTDDGVATRAQRLAAKYAALRASLRDTVRLGPQDVRAARTDLVDRANASVSRGRRTTTAARELVLGTVPDRGGRVTAAAKANNAATKGAFAAAATGAATGAAAGAGGGAGSPSRGRGSWYRGGGGGGGGGGRGGGGGAARGGGGGGGGGAGTGRGHPEKRPKTG
jgi:hypothetical protein